MNIGIYLGGGAGAKVDLSTPYLGNPGIGGTQYMMALLGYYLSKDNSFGITFISVSEYVFWKGADYVRISEDSKLLAVCESRNVDILILRDYNDIIANQILLSSIKVVYWSHNYISTPLRRFICNTEQVKCNVFVSKQQYDSYIDDDVIKKSTYIFNMFPDSCHEIRDNDDKTVVFMGAILEGKGFKEMCRIWKRILRRVPDAKLLVLGSGELYGNVDLGPYGLAPVDYEKSFIKDITDKDGNILPSISFLGVVGAGKTDIFLHSSVGVINPSRARETFGMGIVEMAAASLPVATIAKSGYYDTIANKESGYLSHNLFSLSRRITQLLLNHNLNSTIGDNAKQYITKFAPADIVPKWISLLSQVYYGTLEIETVYVTKPYLCSGKIIRILNRLMRINLGLQSLPSISTIEEYAISRIRGQRDMA